MYACGVIVLRRDIHGNMGINVCFDYLEEVEEGVHGLEVSKAVQSWGVLCLLIQKPEECYKQVRVETITESVTNQYAWWNIMHNYYQLGQQPTY